MLPLRYPRFWLALGMLFVGLALLVCLAPSDTPVLEELFSLNDKAEHAAGYVALTIWFAGMYPRSRYLWIAIGLFTMGVMVEFLQGWMAVGRNCDVLDVVANTSGIVIGMGLSLTIFGGWTQHFERVLIRRER